MLELPRSARLVAWGNALVAADRGGPPDPGALEAAVRAVQGTDEPHAVDGLPGAEALAGALGLLVGLAAASPAGVPAGGTATGGPAGAGASREPAERGRLRLALPVPGDPHGLPGPAGFNSDALDAEEAVVLDTATAAWGLWPDVTVFGSVYEPGAMVTWRAAPVERRTRPEPMALPDAQRALRQALLEATRALADLDLARWREDAAHRIAAVRDGALERSSFPPSTPGEVVAVAASAARVRAIVALAVEDDGAATTGWEASSRARSLREVDAVARHALAVAVNTAP